MKSNTLIRTLAAGLLAVSLFGCSSQESTEKQKSPASDADNQKVTLGVVGAIYEDLWQPTVDSLKDQGIDLELVQFADFSTPNNALNEGETDLNAFQHEIYLNTEKEQHGYNIEPIGYTFIIPLNVYSQKYKSVDELPEGAVIAIPDDVTNGGRALKVLENAGLVSLKDDAGFSPTVDDITETKNGIQIKELKANTLASALPDVDAAVITGNFALDYGLKTEEAIYTDDALDQKEYWNLIAANSEDLKDPEKKELYEKIVETFQSDETADVFKNDFGGYFIPEGWDENLLEGK